MPDWIKHLKRGFYDQIELTIMTQINQIKGMGNPEDTRIAS